jgi:hypothetical protein
MKTVSTVALILLSIVAIIYFIYDYNSFTFKADIDDVAFKGDRGGAHYESHVLQIAAVHDAPETLKVVIVLNASKVGTYLLNDDPPRTGNVAMYGIGGTVFASTNGFTGSTTITKLDLEEKKLSGTFAFRAVQVSPQGSKVVNVTNGVFEDIPIRYIGTTTSHDSDTR